MNRGEAFNVYDEDGKFLKDGKKLNEALWGIIVQAFKHSADNKATIDPKESLHDFFQERVQEMFPAIEESRERKIMMQMTEMWGAFVGSPVQTQSLKFFWLEECIDGGKYSAWQASLLNVVHIPASSNVNNLRNWKH